MHAVRVLNALRPPLVAIDVGTAVTRLSFGSGAVYEQPSIVREHVHGATVVRPAMRGGVVADIAGVAAVVHALLERKQRRWRKRPAAVICAPTDVSAQERDALIEAVAEGGASVATVVPEPLAAAVGAGVDIASDYASAVVDIGEGVTDLAVFRGGAMIRSSARRVGCGTLRDAIHEWLELRHGVKPLPDAVVEPVVRAYCRGERAAGTLLPVTVAPDDLETLLEPVIEDIASFLGRTLRELPDALAAEVIESGIHVTGGGAHLDRLVRSIERAVGLPLARASDPRHAVIRGAEAMLEHRNLLH